MKTNYWIVKLESFRLLGLIRRQGREQITRMTYLDATTPARMLLTTFKKFIRFPVRRVESRNNPSGPRFNMANVRNDKGETLIIHLYHQVLAVRRKIWEELKETFKDAPFLKNAVSLNMMGAILGMKIAEEITPTVYLANYARWGNHRAEDTQNILIIPESNWSGYLSKELSHLVDRVIIGKKETKVNLKRRLWVFLYRAAARIGAKQET
ncbi:MAG: hypothetical protein GY950_19790, partial [bacterium]|nr:hypothetical protein [bacterium]